MSAMTNLLVKDDTATTRVEHILKPVTDTPNPIWRAVQADVPIAGQVRFSLAQSKTPRGTKMQAKLEVPVMESLGTAGTSAGYVATAKVAYVNTAIFTMFADDRSTNQNRADLLAMMVGLLQGASSVTATGTLNQTSAGNAFATSSLPIVNAFVEQITPN